MGRHCGWLTAYSALEYRKILKEKNFLPDILITKDRWDIDAIYIPEMEVNFHQEVERLLKVMDKKDGVNIFLSEGAGVETIIAQLEAEGKEIHRDAFGHVRLDEINPGQWFGKRFGKALKADKILVQKSGYFARSSKPNKKDLDLIIKTADLAVESALNGEIGVVGLDEDHKNKLRCIAFGRIKGGKPFDFNVKWYQDLLKEIGQI